jgi:hypothetical protein
VIGSSSRNAMAVRPSVIFGDDTKDISAATYSLPPSDLITRSVSSFFGQRAKIYRVRPPTQRSTAVFTNVQLHLHAAGKNTSTKVDVGSGLKSITCPPSTSSWQIRLQEERRSAAGLACACSLCVHHVHEHDIRACTTHRHILSI